MLRTALADTSKMNRDAILENFLFLLARCPAANASDLWHHVTYRSYCEIFPHHRAQDAKQSWVRASGEALELAVEALYSPVLSAEGIGIASLIGGPQKKEALAKMGLGHLVGSAKLDLVLYRRDGAIEEVFGGVHVKASLAERVSDDVPCSRAMMSVGLLSPLWTLDVKSFPPPAGRLVNRGELGSPAAPSEKRRYIEEHGEFDNCYSANLRTVASVESTRSGKKIYTLNLSQQPDMFARDVIAACQRHRGKS